MRTRKFAFEIIWPLIFGLPYLFSFVRCSIRERWRGSLFQLPFVGISWIYLCLCSADPSLCFFQIMGSIDCTRMWYGRLFVHWTSGMEKKQTAIIWMRKKKVKKKSEKSEKMSLSYQSQSYFTCYSCSEKNETQNIILYIQTYLYCSIT